MRDILDKVDLECKWDRQLCFCIEVCATGNGINPDRVVLQEGHEGLLELCVNTVCHVLFSDLEEVIYQLQGSNGGGFDWVDESEEDLEDFCGFCDLDDGDCDVSCDGLGWLGEGKHVEEEG